MPFYCLKNLLISHTLVSRLQDYPCYYAKKTYVTQIQILSSICLANLSIIISGPTHIKSWIKIFISNIQCSQPERV